MALARLNSEAVSRRKDQIKRLEVMIERWEKLKQTPQTARDALAAARVVEEKEALKRVKTLSFATINDQIELAKIAGRLELASALDYDISEADRRIEDARKGIANLVEEIRDSFARSEEHTSELQ